MEEMPKSLEPLEEKSNGDGIGEDITPILPERAATFPMPFHLEIGSNAGWGGNPTGCSGERGSKNGWGSK